MRTIGLAPVIAVGSEQVKKKVCPDVISGKKTICLAITEPGGGSDVANMATEAVLSEDKSHEIK